MQGEASRRLSPSPCVPPWLPGALPSPTPLPGAHGGALH